MWVVVWVLLLYDVELITSNPVSTTFNNEGELDLILVLTKIEF